MFSKVSAGSLLLAGLFFSETALASPTQCGDLASLINQRLSYMKDVAGYKAEKHLAIEDVPQEVNVLANSVAVAEKLGLHGESVKPFIQAQMDAAKAIQYRYRADWLSVAESNWRPDPLPQVRSKISGLNTDILSCINATLLQGERFTNKTAFLRVLDQANLKESDKARIWYSLQQITLKSP
ncbi:MULTISPECIES: chorismate mutase [unclassified Symbiopectobacterium]|uniref:chorismate mutase n=1 Tax=unclassified Symbiopectobacterium TaxID=2794573 RepID=UPI0022278E3C|nr:MULTISPECIES: chorismate mutase [unclassified Symbiopectobacterium]MCW2475249.1 chorismate mutase [Candidatus Symbiopectobacterium sp. NZEC151]MCW2483494.1 chorismate mutase [Candidatus Symbiopectobacterium sp. NZEC135]